MEYLTADNIQYAMIAATWIIYAAKKLIQMTATKRDDALLAEIERGYEWVQGFAPKAFFLVEELAKTGKLPKLEKACEFIRLVRDTYLKEQGKPLPKSLETAANIYAQGKAAIDKVNLLKDEINYKLFGGASPTAEAVEEPYPQTR